MFDEIPSFSSLNSCSSSGFSPNLYNQFHFIIYGRRLVIITILGCTAVQDCPWWTRIRLFSLLGSLMDWDIICLVKLYLQLIDGIFILNESIGQKSFTHYQSSTIWSGLSQDFYWVNFCTHMKQSFNLSHLFRLFSFFLFQFLLISYFFPFRLRYFSL